MKFKLTVTGQFYNTEELKELEELGFEFQEHDFMEYTHRLVRNDDLTIEINSLDELLAFTKEHGDMVLESPSKYEELFTLEIYNDYRE